jgi:hypothetical protein
VRALTLLGAVVAVGAAACGNSTAQPTDGGAIEDALFSKALPTPSAGCPQQAPAQEDTCSPEAYSCEYPGEAGSGCDTEFICGSGLWGVRYSCLPAPGPNAASCPQDYLALDDAGCQDMTASCDYDGGILCACSLSVFAPADAGPTWTCTTQPDCPAPRPLIGSSCAGSVDCPYYPCWIDEVCSNGV